VPEFGRRKRGGASHDQIMAVDVQLEDHIRKIEDLVGGYLRSSQDEATRQALMAELERFDDKAARSARRGPTPALASALGSPASARRPIPQRLARSARLTGHAANAACCPLPRPDCPARGHRATTGSPGLSLA